MKKQNLGITEKEDTSILSVKEVPDKKEGLFKVYSPSERSAAVYNFITPLDSHLKSKKGVEAQPIIQSIQQGLGVSLKELATLLGIAESTIHKYKRVGQKISDERMAQQLILLTSLAEHGQSIFPKTDGFHQWMRKPQWDLYDANPLSFLNTIQGIVYVDEILSRIEHGLPA